MMTFMSCWNEEGWLCRVLAWTTWLTYGAHHSDLCCFSDWNKSGKSVGSSYATSSCTSFSHNRQRSIFPAVKGLKGTSFITLRHVNTQLCAFCYFFLLLLYWNEEIQVRSSDTILSGQLGMPCCFCLLMGCGGWGWRRRGWGWRWRVWRWRPVYLGSVGSPAHVLYRRHQQACLLFCSNEILSTKHISWAAPVKICV